MIAHRSGRRILDLKRPRQYRSFDEGLYGHITFRNLAALAAERGDHALERRLWEAVLADCPDDRQVLVRLKRRPVADGGVPVRAAVASDRPTCPLCPYAVSSET